MSIQGIGNSSQASPVQKVIANPIQKSLPTDATSAPPTSPSRGSDKVELSSASSLLASLKAGNDVRADKVADIRAQIESGTYDTDDKVNGALDGLLDDMNL
jgi:negative regulator of flagellin synthesis FlgM